MGSIPATQGPPRAVYIDPKPPPPPPPLKGPITAVEWDSAGELVAVLQEGSSVVELWDIKTRRATPLDTNLKDPTFLKWSTTGENT